MEPETLELIERGVEALEKLASDPIIEFEMGPPLCPHCGQLNPRVKFDSSDPGEGKLGEIAIDCWCGNCDGHMWIVIESYSMHRDRDNAIAEIEERNEAQERAGENGKVG